MAKRGQDEAPDADPMEVKAGAELDSLLTPDSETAPSESGTPPTQPPEAKIELDWTGAGLDAPFPLIDDQPQIRVIVGYRGKRTAEDYIEPGLYQKGDPDLYGLEEFLIESGRAEWAVPKGEG